MLRGDQQMDKDLVLKTKIMIEIVDTVLIYTKGVDIMDQCDATTRTANGQRFNTKDHRLGIKS